MSNTYKGPAVQTVDLAANNVIKEVSLEIAAPHVQDAGNVKIGTILVKKDGVTLDRIDLIQDTKNMLHLDELKIEYKTDEDDSQSEDACDEGTFCEDDGTPTTYNLEDKVKIGTVVQLTFKLENLFNKDYNDGDLESVQITIESDDSDLYTDDFEEEFDIEDISADEKLTQEFEFTVNSEAEVQAYTLNVKIEAEDGQGQKYVLEREIDLDTLREKDDIRIQQAQLTPNTVSSCSPSYSLNVELENFGSKKQNFAILQLKSDALKINQEVKNIEIEEFEESDSTYEDSFTFSLPKDTKTGTYAIDVLAYVRTNDLSDQQRIELTVESCGQLGEDDAADEEDETPAPSTPPRNQTVQPAPPTTVTPPAAQPTPPVTGAQPTPGNSYQVSTSIEDPYTVEDLFIAGIVIAVVLIIALIVVFFVLLMRR